MGDSVRNSLHGLGRPEYVISALWRSTGVNNIHIVEVDRSI